MESFRNPESVMNCGISGDDNQCSPAIAACVQKRYIRPKCLTLKRGREIRQFLSSVIANPLPYASTQTRIDMDHVKTALKDSMNKTRGSTTIGLISDRDVNWWLAKKHFTQELNVIKTIRVLPPDHSLHTLPRDEGFHHGTHFRMVPLASNPVANPGNMDNSSIGTVEDGVSATNGSGPWEVLPGPVHFQSGYNKDAVVDLVAAVPIDSSGMEPGYEGDEVEASPKVELDGHLLSSGFSQYFFPPHPFGYTILSNTSLPEQTEPLDLSVSSQSAVVDQNIVKERKQQPGFLSDLPSKY